VLYCVHRYFFSRDSIYFSTRFSQLDIRDHEPLPTIISLGDIESEGFDAFLSILYPEYVLWIAIYPPTYRGVSVVRNFEGNDFSYKDWKSVLHLSTRWGFASIRRLALGSINPPTPHDRLLLARTYSVDDWVTPALSALCERATPLSLSEACQMSIEDVVLVSTVREDIRSHTLQVDSAEIPLRVEAEQLCALGLEIPVHLRFPKHKVSSPVDLKRVGVHEGDGELSVSHSCRPFGELIDDGIVECLQAEEGVPGNKSVLKVKPAHLTKNGRRSCRGKVAATHIIETGKEALMTNNIPIQRDGPEEDDNGVAICTPKPNSKPPASRANEELTGLSPVTGPAPGSAESPVLPCYSVGRGVSLPFSQLLPQCCECDCNALIAWSNRSGPKETGVVCLAHGLNHNSNIRDLVLKWTVKFRYRFISPEHEAALRAFVA
jgi:hypothetical protein